MSACYGSSVSESSFPVFSALQAALLDGRPGRSGRAGCGGDVLTELQRGWRFESALRDLVEEGLITDLQEAGGVPPGPLGAREAQSGKGHRWNPVTNSTPIPASSLKK